MIAVWDQLKHYIYPESENAVISHELFDSRNNTKYTIML